MNHLAASSEVSCHAGLDPASNFLDSCLRRNDTASGGELYPKRLKMVNDKLKNNGTLITQIEQMVADFIRVDHNYPYHLRSIKYFSLVN